MTTTDPAFGSPEHATLVTENRQPGIRDGLQWLAFTHLPEQLQEFSEPFYTAAVEIILTVTTDSPELTTALNGLITAKDSAVRAGIRHNTGRAGSVPRPQTVVNPPKLSYDEETLHKVYQALRGRGLSETTVDDCVNAMQNEGILFRERA